MPKREIKPIFVFQLLIAGFCFYCAWPFWYSLLDGLALSDDIMAPLAYGFCSLTGAITLLLLCRKKSISSLLRIGMIIGAVVLIGMPFLITSLRNWVILPTILVIAYWAASLTFIGGLTTLLVKGKQFNKMQKGALLFTLVISILGPFMPWMEFVLYTLGLAFKSRIFSLYAAYGNWLVVIVWGLAAYSMIHFTYKRKEDSIKDVVKKGQVKIARTMLSGFIIGLAFFFIGIRNSVQYNETVYEQRTYIGGQLTGTDIVSIPDLNMLLLLGMALIIFTMLIYGISRAGQLD
jgi:hypothetical protein